MTIQNLIIKHKQFALNDFWKYQYLTFKIHNGSITLSLYTKDYKKTCKLQYSVDNGNNWNDVIKVEKKSVINDNECKAKYTIGTFDNSVKLRGNVLIENSNQWGVFSVKCNKGATYDVCGNPASLCSSDSFASVRTIDLSNLFANKVKISDDELYYDDNKLFWKDSGENLIFTKESSDIKYDGNSVYQDNGLQSIKNLWLQHPNGTYTNMFIGSNVKTITDYMPISGKCEGMFYCSQITSDDLKLQLPSIQNTHLYEGMFAYCPNIKNITVNNIQNEDIYAGMFLGCKNLEKINVTYSNITSSLSKTIKSMFFECNNINQFNITFDNISVPVFDEYFRFTIPSTLTDCSKSELNILNSEATTSVYKLFYNSKIETAPTTICNNNGVYSHLFDQSKTNIHSIKIICNSLNWFNNSDIFGSGAISPGDNGNKKIKYLDVSECNEFSKTIFQRIQLSDYNYIPTVKINKNIDPNFITRSVGALANNGWIAKAATNIIHKDDLNNTYTIYNDIFKDTRFRLIQLAEEAKSGLKIILNYNNYVKSSGGHPNHIAINPFNDKSNRKNFLEGFRHQYQDHPNPSLFYDTFDWKSIKGYNSLIENIACQVIVEFNEKITITFKQQDVQVLQFSTSSGNSYNETYKGKPLSIGNTNSSIESCQVYLKESLNESLINTYIPIKWKINNEYISGLLDSKDMIYH